jgi:hypothetical protein
VCRNSAIGIWKNSFKYSETERRRKAWSPTEGEIEKFNDTRGKGENFCGFPQIYTTNLFAGSILYFD